MKNELVIEQNEQPTLRVEQRQPRRRIGLLVFCLLVLGLTWYIFAEVIAYWLNILLVIVAVFVSLYLLVLLIRGIQHTRNRNKIEQQMLLQAMTQTQIVALERDKAAAEVEETRARAKKAELEARYAAIVADRDKAVFVLEEEGEAWKALHLNPRFRINGDNELPSPLELATWDMWIRGGSKTAAPATVLPGHQPALLGSGLPDRVDLKELLFGKPTLRNLVLGVRYDEATGQLRQVSAPIHRLVHIGAAGATDSGKSNFGRMLGVQVANVVEPVELIFVDSKQTTFKIFRDIPRLRYPLISTPQEFYEAIIDLEAELERRKSLFEPFLTVETLEDYNRQVSEELRLPIIVAFIDEVSNLFMNETIKQISLRMIRECRAFGIHFVNLGQSWSHREMVPSFREQHRTTGHFGTNNPHSSRMMLNRPDAVHITVPGRALFALPFGMAGDVVEIQTPYLAPEEALRMLPSSTGPPPPPPPQVEVVSADSFEREGDLPERDQAAIDGWKEGLRGKDLVARVYGPEKTGGKQYELVRTILRRHALIGGEGQPADFL
ncbi:MAG: hypothetical protein BroJett011_07700 [Chloroflexota bacterium]|nr:MAG: hypothetical protein BroJett011_07700 [Chloroflexota bacterium]